MVHQVSHNTTFFPPEKIEVISSIKHIPLVKHQSFLHQKYVKEGLSINQIVALTFSSRSTIIKYLRQAKIELRAADKQIGRAKYGERRQGGIIVPNKAELETIAKIKALKDEGLNYTRIAEIMESIKMPTKRGGKWTRKTIYSIVNDCPPRKKKSKVDQNPDSAGKS